MYFAVVEASNSSWLIPHVNTASVERHCTLYTPQEGEHEHHAAVITLPAVLQRRCVAACTQPLQTPTETIGAVQLLLVTRLESR